MALDPLGEIAVRPLHVCEHHRFLLRNLRPDDTRLPAARRHPHERAQQPLLPADRWTPAQPMPAREIEVQTISATASPPSFRVPVQNVPGRIASRADQSIQRELASVATIAGRDQPRPQQDLRRRSVHLDHEPLAGPGDLGEERLGYVKRRLVIGLISVLDEPKPLH
jgi:hypothetical protein